MEKKFGRHDEPVIETEPPQTGASFRFAPAAVFARERERLMSVPAPDWRHPPRTGLNHARALRPAAVLLSLATYEHEVRVLFTQRTAALTVHSGQIALPGGKIEPDDDSPAASALREAREEIGLDSSNSELLGYLDTFATGTGFWVTPVVAKLAPPIALRLNRDEVDDVFEVPFAFLMDAANHELHHKKVEGRLRHYHAIPYKTRNIWGVTAHIVRALYERLYC